MSESDEAPAVREARDALRQLGQSDDECMDAFDEASAELLAGLLAAEEGLDAPAEELQGQALELGHRMFGTSWLGLGERSGLGHTEELLGVLATATDRQLSDLGTDRDRLGVSGWRPERIAETARAAAST